jgi:hypothetical protein
MRGRRREKVQTQSRIRETLCCETGIATFLPLLTPTRRYCPFRCKLQSVIEIYIIDGSSIRRSDPFT